MEKSKSITALKMSCKLDERNPLDDLFEVLKNPSKTAQSRRFVDRDLPRSFFNPKNGTLNSRSGSLNPKREQEIRAARQTHFQSLRRMRNKSGDLDNQKAHTLNRPPESTNIHKRSHSAPSMSKDSPTLSVSRSSIPARRKMLLARAHFKQVQTNNNSNQHSKPSLRPFAGLSFKTENISVDRIPLPKGWEMISNTIDGKEEIFFRNFENDQNTRQDPRIPIKVHLEELHCQLTTEMISRLNNPSAYNPNNERLDLDLPAGCSWRQTERGEVFFANDISQSTSWLHPRVEMQLRKEKLPPLNSTKLQEGPSQTSKEILKDPKEEKSRKVPTHQKQISVDSGVGSTCSILPRSNSFRRARSISANSITDGRLVVHAEINDQDISTTFSPMSLSPTPDMDLGSPMDTTMDDPGPQGSFQSLASPTFPDLTSPALMTSSPIPNRNPENHTRSHSTPKTMTPPFLNYEENCSEEIVLEEIPPGQLLPVAPLTGSSPQLFSSSFNSQASTSMNFSMPSEKVSDFSQNGTQAPRPLTLRLDQPPTQTNLENRKRNGSQLFHSKSVGEMRLGFSENSNCEKNSRELLTSPNVFPFHDPRTTQDQTKICPTGPFTHAPLISDSQLPLSLKPPLPLEEELGTGIPFPPLDLTHDSNFITNLLNDADLQL